MTMERENRNDKCHIAWGGLKEGFMVSGGIHLSDDDYLDVDEFVDKINERGKFAAALKQNNSIYTDLDQTQIQWTGKNLEAVMRFMGIKLDMAVAAAAGGIDRYHSLVAGSGLKVMVRGKLISAVVGDFIVRDSSNNVFVESGL